MDWISLIGAAGIGGLAVKFLDIVWLQRALERQEQKRWIREKRFEAFSQLSQALLSFALAKNVAANHGFEFYSLAAPAMLLIEDSALRQRIDQFIVDWDKLMADRGKSQDGDKIYVKLVAEARTIVAQLNLLLAR